MLRFTKKRAAVLLAALAAVGIAAVAVAYFSGSGSGTGSASVGSASKFEVNVSSDATGSLYPGAGSETLKYTVTNPSKGAQNLATTSAAVASSGGNITEKGTAVVGCKSEWFEAVNHPPALPQDLAGGATSTEGTVTVTMNDSKTNQDECQGKKPDITVTVG